MMYSLFWYTYCPIFIQSPYRVGIIQHIDEDAVSTIAQPFEECLCNHLRKAYGQKRIATVRKLKIICIISALERALSNVVNSLD